MISITQSAKDYLLEQLESNCQPSVKLQVRGGGCAGFSYEYEFGGPADPLDIVIPLDEAHTFVLDGMSVVFVAGTTLDYVRELGGSSLKLSNPNEKSSCGCGKSFNI